MASCFVQLFWTLGFVLLGGVASAKPLSSRLFYGSAESNLYRSESVGGNTRFKAGEHTYELSFQNEKRDFGRILLTETTLGLSLNYQTGDSQYGEVRLLVAPEAGFSADRRLSFEHHLVVGDYDAMVVARASQYSNPERTIPGFSLGFRHDVGTSFFELRGHVDEDQGPRSAVELRLGSKLSEMFALRVSGATGEEIVDPGVFNQMKSVTTSVLFDFSAFSLDLSYLTLWGERRNETGALAGIETSW